MTKPVQPSADSDRKLSELAKREQKLRDKWLSFKKKLRASKGIDPDSADQKFREEEAKFEGAMSLLQQQRERLARSSSFYCTQPLK